MTTAAITTPTPATGPAPPPTAEANLGLCGAVYRRHFAGRCPDRDHLMSAGQLALLNAARLYDPARNVRFGSYAYNAIYREMTRAALELGPVRVPQNAHLGGGRSRELAAAARRPVSLSNIDGEPGDLIAALTVPAPDYRDEADAVDVYTLIDAATLTDNERRVIAGRFGLRSVPMTLQDLGDELGCTRENVRLIEKRALVKLRRAAVVLGLEGAA
jgi:RNA polymerase sigma factor (sigma-70 family)